MIKQSLSFYLIGILFFTQTISGQNYNISNINEELKENAYAVGAFNILDYNSMLAVVRAAEQEKAPVIIQTSAKTVIFWGADAIFNWAQEIAGSSEVPVALHLDHCKDLDLIKDCINAGWTAVMIDAP